MQSETSARGALSKCVRCDGPLELTTGQGARRADIWNTCAARLALLEGGEDRFAEVAQEQHVSAAQLWLLLV